MSSMGERIRTRREALQLTLEDVGRRLGVNRSTVRRYENGETRRIPLSTIRRLAEILGVTPEYLLGLGAQKPPEPLDQDVMVMARAMQKIPPQQREIIGRMIRAMSDIADEELRKK